MGYSAAHPWMLLLLIAIPAYIWYMHRYATRMVGSRKRIALVIRAIILVLIIALVADVRPYTSTDRKNIVVIVDRSASVGTPDNIIPFLNEAAKQPDEWSYQAILSFANTVAIDRPFSELQSLSSFRTRVDRNGTNAANALRQAAGMLGKDGGGRVLLFSDGFETSGHMLREIDLLKSLDIAVDVLPISSKREADAAISSFKVPGHLKAGEKYQMSISIQSTDEASATIILYEDDRILKEATVQLLQGENTFVIDQIASSAGLHKYRAVVQAEQDTEPLNNNAYSISRTDGPVGVLLVEGDGVSSTNVQQALEASYIGYTTIKPEELSYELAQYLQYDSIIFNNVSAVKVPESKMNEIASAVRDYGVGFMMLGGDQSFGVGGYFDTPIEDILPVSMELTGKRQLPKLGLVLVIDHSGSMIGDNIELAKEAAIRTVEFLRGVDTVSVIAFDDKPTIVVPPTLVSEQDEIITAIQSIQADGGTNIYPALQTAYEQLLEMASERKHIILLTDGQSGASADYKQLTEEMTTNHMTMSTVAVGDGADTALLTQLAKEANGRYYFTNDQSSIPAIFSREAVMMSRAYIVEQPFTPKIGYAGSWNQLWSEGLPKVDAYVATSAKDLAEIALYSQLDDPLLARWNVGAGKAVAFTSDVNGQWSSNWVKWSQFPDLFNEWVKWTYPQFVSSPYSITAEASKLYVSTNSSSTQSNLMMNLITETNQQYLPLIPTGDGRYEVETEELESGIYFTQIGENNEPAAQSPLTNAITAGFVVPYAKEYELHIDSNKGEEQLSQLAEQTGGRVLQWEDASSLYQFEPISVKEYGDWSRIFLMLILALWLLDIGNRRLSIAWYTFNAWFIKARRRVNTHRQQAKQDTLRPPVNTSIHRLSKKMKEEKAQSKESANSTSVVQPETNERSIVSRKESNEAVPPATPTATPEEKTTMNRLLAAKNRKKH